MRARILVVEDNRFNCELLCDWLETEGYDVVSARDLKEALAAIQSGPPDIVLLDVKLGAEDGLSLASWIREQPAFRCLPVIAVTAHAMMTEQQRILAAGCNAWVPKPIDFKILSDQLHLWLAPSAASQRHAGEA